MHESNMRIGLIKYLDININSRYETYDNLKVLEKFLDLSLSKNFISLIDHVFIDDKCGQITIILIRNFRLEGNLYDLLESYTDDFGSSINYSEYTNNI